MPIIFYAFMLVLIFSKSTLFKLCFLVGMFIVDQLVQRASAAKLTALTKRLESLPKPSLPGKPIFSIRGADGKFKDI